MNLTAAAVKKAKPESKAYEIPDSTLRGFILRVQPSGKKVYRVRYRVNGRQTSATIGDANIITLTQARINAKEMLSDAAFGIDTQQRKKQEKSSTLGGYIKEYYRQYAQDNIKSYGKTMTTLETNFGHLYTRPLTAITEMDIQRWRKGRSVAFSTLQRDLNYLIPVLNRAVKDKVITHHQLKGYRLEVHTDDQVSDPKIRFLSDDEEASLRASLVAREARLRQERASGNEWRAARGRALMPVIGANEFADHVRPIVLLGLNTGLRHGDLLSLEWRHVDFGLKQIRKIINKTSRKITTPAVLPLSKEAYATLKQWRKQTKGKGLVFPSPKTGAKLGSIKKVWTTVIGDADIPSFTFHDLRHTFASRLVASGVDLNTVRELMTHSDINMTLVYAHLSPDHKAAALASVFDKQG